MRLYILTTLLIFSLSALAQNRIDPHPAIERLFENYYRAIKEQNIELLKEQLTKKVYRDWGGEKGLREMMEIEKEKPIGKYQLEIKPALNSPKLYFVKIKPETGPKPDSSFIVVEENKKFKIKGTISDSE